MQLAETAFTIFDIETTGLDPKKDRIIEIAGVHVRNGVLYDEETFVSLVNPRRAIHWEANLVNRIDEGELQTAPTIEDVLPKFLTFAEGTILVAHNASFDFSFLQVEKEGCWGFIDIPETLCTLELSRSLAPAAHRHTLEMVAERLNIFVPEGRHRALVDVLLTAQVFLKLVQEGKIHTLSELRQKASPRIAVGRV